MVGLDHSAAPPADPECARTSARNSRLGLVLFAIYLVVYAAFVLLNAFQREVMDRIVWAGINLATVYGLALIVLAFVLALVYGWMCRAPLTDSQPKEPLP